MIVGIAGLAGSGKSTVADVLHHERGFHVVSLSDPLKAACAEWFGWTHDRLYGPSECRNAPDPRWNGLTARHALQQLGTEFGRAMHPDVWVRYALSRARAFKRVVIPDCRFQNEVDAVLAAGGRVYVVERPGVGRAFAHASEGVAELTGVTGVLVNDGSLDELRAKVRAL